MAFLLSPLVSTKLDGLLVAHSVVSLHPASIRQQLRGERTNRRHRRNDVIDPSADFGRHRLFGGVALQCAAEQHRGPLGCSEEGARRRLSSHPRRGCSRLQPTDGARMRPVRWQPLRRGDRDILSPWSPNTMAASSRSWEMASSSSLPVRKCRPMRRRAARGHGSSQCSGLPEDPTDRAADRDQFWRRDRGGR